MVKKRRRHTAAYKFRVALEALEGSKTISQLPSEHEIHPNLIRARKRQLLEDGPRVLDNVFCERLWRSVKYENIYLNQYDTVRQLQTGLTAYFDFYNHGWVGEGTSCLNGYFFPKPPVKPDVIVSHHPAFSVLPR